MLDEFVDNADSARLTSDATEERTIRFEALAECPRPISLTIRGVYLITYLLYTIQSLVTWSACKDVRLIATISTMNFQISTALP